MSTKRGRPPLDPSDASTQLNLRLPAKDYDRALARASKDRVSVSEWVRRTIRTASDDSISVTQK